jgi:AbrB family looped-hinge helix DNA binding protein
MPSFKYYLASRTVLQQGWLVTVKGQVTIPKPVRDHLGLRPGDRVEFAVDADGGVLLRKAAPGPHQPADRFTRLLGCATAGLTTDEIMAMTRGED